MKDFFKKINLRHLSIWGFVLSLLILFVFKVLNNRFFSREQIQVRIVELFQTQSEFQQSLLPKVEDELIPSIIEKKEAIYLDPYWTNLYDQNQTAVFLYKNDSILFWNTTQIYIESNYVYNTYNNLIAFRKRGVYTCLAKTLGDYKIVMLTEIQKNTAIPSEPNHFEFEFEYHIPDEVEIVDLNYENDYGEVYPLVSKENNEWAKIYIPNEYTKGNGKWENFLLGFAGYMFFLIGLAYQSYFKRPRDQAIFTLFVVLLSALYLYLEATVNLSGKNYGIGLFDSSLYASGYIIPSLGDLFNWMLVFALWSLLFILYVMRFIERQHKPYFSNSQWVYVLLGKFEIIAAFPLLLIPGDLIKNSTINLDFNFVTSFNIDSMAGVAIILFAVVAYMIFVISSVFFMCRHEGNWSLYNIGRIATFILVIFIFQPPLWNVIIFAAFCFVVVFYLRIYYEKRLKGVPDFFLILYSVLCSFFVGYLLYEATIEKRKAEAKFYAEKVINQADPALNYYFLKSSKSFLADTPMVNMLKRAKGKNEELINLAVDIHFNNYWSNYSIIPYYKSDSIFKSGQNADNEFFANFDARLNNGTNFDNGEFNYKKRDSSYWQFLGKIPLEGLEKDSGDVLYLLFETKKYVGKTGLPEFLIKRPYYLEILQEGYHTGRYVNGRLIEKSGTISMPAFMDEENYTTLLKNANKQLYYLTNSHEAVLIVDVNNPFLSYINTVCILFLLFLIVISILRSTTSVFSGVKHQRSIGSTFRLLVIISMTVSFLLLLVNSIYTTREEFNNFDKKQISLRGELVKADLEEIIASTFEEGRINNIDLAEELRKLALNHKLDLNYFDPSGKLIYGSRPEIFKEQFRGSYVEPMAYKNLNDGLHSVIYNEETIGDVDFISAFFPVIGPDIKIKGYLQIPYYFEYAQKEADVSYSTNRTVRYFTICITLVLILVLIASNRIAKPLEELRSKIIGFRLGKGFEPIEYKGSDEVASLVKAYNIAIADLEQSAELLAKSEREKAWREMAKQVAHEIKNPLTPLKLNVQMLERAYFDRRDDFDKRIKLFTKSTLEQIDTMAQIASDFSNFAKLDRVKMDNIDVVPVIKSVVSVFNSFMPNIVVKAEFEENSIIVKADKDMLIRIFNNLIKNACQAIGDTNSGLIEVTVKRDGEYWKFFVKDNGPGISEEMKPSIFKLNFTTKSTGTGIGLAMVQNMVESMQGNIKFESNTELGTCFIIQLPIVE